MHEQSRPSEDRVDRRDFMLRAVGTVAAGTALAAGLTAPDSTLAAKADRWKMRLSCSSINFSTIPIEQAAERIGKLGFEAIDVWSAHAGCPHLDDVQARLGPEGLKEILAKNNLKLYAFSVYKGGYPKYAELLGKCGGGVAVRGSSPPVEPKELTAKMKAFLEALKPELELAEKYDSYLAIENHGHSLLDGPDSFKAFVDLNQHPRLGIALAPLHVQRADNSVEEAIATCGKQLLFFYGWQNAPGIGELPGHGPVDFTPWLTALAKVDYQWYVNPFMHHEPEPDAMSEAQAKAVKYLKKCYTKLSGR
jgi:sugar phosphate isomerase/epimerase